jgi:DNA-binding CsgD family transcriptional regulator
MPAEPRAQPDREAPAPSDDRGPGPRILAAAFLGIALLLGVDLIQDRVQGKAGILHICLEGAASATALGLGLLLLRSLQSRHREIVRLQGALLASREESERWREEASLALRGLGEALDAQFDRWNLSPAEREVALLLLKGFSTREIAELRTTSERTVRQQAQDVYRKGGLSGRAELSAFFLEDLLLPSSRP